MDKHRHLVNDTDVCFKVDTLTRNISSVSNEKTLVQGDHNSERLTFKLTTRKIEDHDMALCDVVQIHYINIDSFTKEKSVGVYEVDDLKISEDDENAVVLSWLISSNATKFAGSLNFLIKFKCVAEDGTEEYVWNTEVYKGIRISDGIDNGKAIAEEYPDIILEFASRINALEQDGNKTRNQIGNADISGIGDGTIKGAILALKAMIESGGGSSGGVTSEAIEIDVEREEYYGENPECEYGEGHYGKSVHSDPVPVYEQLAGCTFDIYLGETEDRLSDPVIEEDGNGNYYIFFTKIGGEKIAQTNSPHLFVCNSTDHTGGVYVFFVAVEDAFSAKHYDAEFYSGTITFPQLGDGGSSDGDSGGVTAEAFTVKVYDEDEYGESPTADVGENGEMPLVSYMLPTKEQAENCYLQGSIGESTCKFLNPTIEESYCGYWIVFTKAEAVYGSGEANDADARLFISDGSSIEEGIYVLYHSFNTYGSAAVGYDGELNSADIYFPEV